MSLAILTANWSANVGGVSKTVASLLQAIRETSVEEVVLVAPRAHVASDGSLPEPDVSVDGERIRLAASTFSALWRIRPVLTHANDDFFMALGAALFRVISRRSNRLVYTIHTLQERHPASHRRPLDRFRHGAKRATRSIAHALILMVADRVVVLTQSMMDEMSRIEQWAARRKADIIPFGTRLTTPSATDIESFRRQFGLENRWPVLCTVGVFFHDWKVRGHELLIDAVDRLRADFPSIVLVIVGDGQHRGRIERHIKENGLDPHVRITGYLPNAYAALACTDVYTHMALREAQGVAIVEAMLAGKPIVAANRGGIPEVTPDGEAALLVEPSAEAVEQAVRRLLTDPALARRLAENAKARAKSRFSPEATNSAYLALYRELRLEPQESE